MGKGSGWTEGTITNTCTTENVPDSYQPSVAKTLLCQYVTSIYSLGGDSGAPVFDYYLPSGYAFPYGIMWGGPSDNYNITIFSARPYVQQELGFGYYGQ